MKRHLLPLAAVCLCVSSAQAQIISVNFRIGTNDNNTVDADESATSMVPVSGANWNNITVRSSGSGTVDVAFDGTALVDDS